jgi:cell division protein FtsN
MLLVAALSYWMGARSWQRQSSQSEAQQPEIIYEPAPVVSSAPDREVRAARPRRETRPVEHSASPPASAPAKPQPAEAPPAAAVPVAPAANPAPAVAKPLVPWPATESKGGYGRIVRIGAFGTREQAKLGWRYMVRAYPAVAHLQATVVEVRNSRGRPYYRFQIGTTSQAHSEVLCQRMEKISLSCAVVGLPWKPAGVER